jgi:hypothetical protein
MGWQGARVGPCEGDALGRRPGRVVGAFAERPLPPTGCGGAGMSLRRCSSAGVLGGGRADAGGRARRRARGGAAGRRGRGWETPLGGPARMSLGTGGWGGWRPGLGGSVWAWCTSSPTKRELASPGSAAGAGGTLSPPQAGEVDERRAGSSSSATPPSPAAMPRVVERGRRSRSTGQSLASRREYGAPSAPGPDREDRSSWLGRVPSPTDTRNAF